MLAKHAGVARHAYNCGLRLLKDLLRHNRENPDARIKFPSAIDEVSAALGACIRENADLHKWLVAHVKSVYSWYYEVSKCAPQQALRNLRKAFDDFFKKNIGFPKFKKKGKCDSFYLEGAIQLESNRIKLPKIGWVKTFERLPIGIQPKNVVVSRHAERWLVSFNISTLREPQGIAPLDVDPERSRRVNIETEPMSTPKLVETVGVDLGVKTLATLSTGEVFEGAKSEKKLEAKLSRLQYLSRKKTIRSQNWQKAQLKIAKLHRRIANIRKDTLHKLTTYLAKNHSQVVIEDLNVSGMLANHKGALAVQDMGFYEFRRQLEYQTKLYGSELTIADRWFPSSKTCSTCGTIKESLSLSERIFICDDCHFVIDRDLNASINLKNLVGSLPMTACGVDDADISIEKQELSRKSR